ncbi:3552_t:CDS:1, partial [Racocetra fulgida]
MKSGFKTARINSPHLIELYNSIRINGQLIQKSTHESISVEVDFGHNNTHESISNGEFEVEYNNAHESISNDVDIKHIS